MRRAGAGIARSIAGRQTSTRRATMRPRAAGGLARRRWRLRPRCRGPGRRPIPCRRSSDELRELPAPRGGARRRAPASAATRPSRSRRRARPAASTDSIGAQLEPLDHSLRSRRPCRSQASRSRARATPARSSASRPGSSDLADRAGQPAHARQRRRGSRICARPRRRPATRSPLSPSRDHLVHRRVVVGDHRQSERHRLVEVQPEALPAARGDADVGGGEQAQVLVGRAGPRGRPRPAGRGRRRASRVSSSRSTWPLTTSRALGSSTRRNAFSTSAQRLALAEKAGRIEEDDSGGSSAARPAAPLLLSPGAYRSSSGWIPQRTRGLSIPSSA